MALELTHDVLMLPCGGVDATNTAAGVAYDCR